MVSYFNAGTQWATKKGNPTKVDPENACGKKIAVQTATVQVDDITARSKKCTDAGKPAITIDQYDGQDEATAAVVSGKDDAVLADSPVVAYAVKQTNGQLELLGEHLRLRARTATWSSKDQTEFAEAIADAVEGADRRRQLQEDPDEVGRRRAARSPTRRSTRRRLTGHDHDRPTRRPRRGTARADPGGAGAAPGPLGRRSRSSRCSPRCSCTCWSRTPRSSGGSWSTTCSRRRCIARRCGRR